MNRGAAQRPPNLGSFGRSPTSPYTMQATQQRTQYALPIAQRTPGSFPSQPAAQPPVVQQRAPFPFQPQSDPPDLTDFPVLGSAQQPASAAAPGVGSYASVGSLQLSQQQQQQQHRASLDSRSSLTADDFPALGGDRDSSSEGGPPGLNGTHFGALPGAQHTPGMLTLGPGRLNEQPPPPRKLTQPTGQQLPHPNGVDSHVPLQQSPQLPPTSASLAPGQTYPHTNAQQVLISPADRWGLLGLISVLKQSRESDLGYDMSQLGMDVTAQPGTLHTTFTSPFFPSTGSALPSPYSEPTFDVPKVYPTGTKVVKVEALSDEALFVLFYSAPRDALQELAADYLHQRMWRFHKPTRLWISRESGPTTKLANGETGTYSVFNVSAENGIWAKERREMTILYADLEERSYKAAEANSVLTEAMTRETRAKELVQQHQLARYP